VKEEAEDKEEEDKAKREAEIGAITPEQARFDVILLERVAYSHRDCVQCTILSISISSQAALPLILKTVSE